MRRLIVSRHFFRRTARQREKAIQLSQQIVAGEIPGTRQRWAMEKGGLDDLGVKVTDRIVVEKAQRGPYRWYVVAY